MPYAPDRNACVIPIIKDKKHPNYATQKSKYRKAFFKLTDSRGGGCLKSQKQSF